MYVYVRFVNKIFTGQSLNNIDKKKKIFLQSIPKLIHPPPTDVENVETDKKKMVWFFCNYKLIWKSKADTGLMRSKNVRN